MKNLKLLAWLKQFSVETEDVFGINFQVFNLKNSHFGKKIECLATTLNRFWIVFQTNFFKRV